MKRNLLTRVSFTVLIIMLALSVTGWTGNPTSVSAAPISGTWTGTTSRGYPMSFGVSPSGTQWTFFKLKTNFNFGACSGTTEITVFGPGNITNNQFSASTGTFSFTGHFNTSSTASGTYAFSSLFISGCNAFLTQSGTWTASIIVQTPGSFNKSIPANGSIWYSTSPVLVWGTSSNASNYEYCYDTSNNNSCNSNWVSTGSFTSVGLNGLSDNTTYYWQVRAVNSAGTTYANGSANAWWSFTTQATAPGTTFADVSLSHWAHDWIERLYNAGITGGCASNPLRYCPDSVVTRDQMAVFLLRGIHGSSYTPPAATGMVFGDVPASYWAAAWIERLAAEGITGGCATGLYCPGNTVTRDQMAVFLLRAKHGSGYAPPPATGAVFSDVPASYWAAGWIEQLAAEAITGGCATGVYCPGSSVTRDQMAVFLVKTFNLP